MRSTGYAKPYKAWCSAVIGWFSTAVIGAFRSSLRPGRPMQDKIKEHDWDIRLARNQISAISEQAHDTRHYPLWEVKFTCIDHDPHWYTHRVKEAIHIRLHPNNINRDSGIEIPEAWMPTIKKHNRRATKKRAAEGAANRNSEDRNAPITAVENQPITAEHHAL